MIIDIILIVAMLIAVMVGMRQGIITQICLLVAVILTTLVTPIIAKPLGAIFTDNEVLAYIAGFCTMLLITVILVWFIAPAIKKRLLNDALRKINAIAGAIVAAITTFLLLSVACATFNSFNLGEINHEKLETLTDDCDTTDEIEEKVAKILDKDPEMRDYFQPRFVSYETLDDSFLFDAFVWTGDTVCPGIETFHEYFASNIKGYLTEKVMDEATAEI